MKLEIICSRSNCRGVFDCAGKPKALRVDKDLRVIECSEYLREGEEIKMHLPKREVFEILMRTLKNSGFMEFNVRRAAGILGRSDGGAALILYNAVRRGWMKRVKRGIYIFR